MRGGDKALDIACTDFLRDGLLDWMLNASARNVETSYISLSYKCDEGAPNALHEGLSLASLINQVLGRRTSQPVS